VSVPGRRNRLERIGDSAAFRNEVNRLAQLSLEDELAVEHDGLTFGAWVRSLPAVPE
jgi:hypothetical protein